MVGVCLEFIILNFRWNNRRVDVVDFSTSSKQGGVPLVGVAIVVAAVIGIVLFFAFGR